MSNKKRDPIDTGTKERAAKGRLVPELTGRGYEFRLRVKDQTELDRLLMEEKIAADTWSVLERFAGDLYKAGFVPLRASNYEPSSPGRNPSMSDEVALRKLTVGQAMKRLDSRVGMAERKILVAVCLDEIELPDRHLPGLLKCAEQLEDFYY